MPVRSRGSHASVLQTALESKSKSEFKCKYKSRFKEENFSCKRNRFRVGGARAADVHR